MEHGSQSHRGTFLGIGDLFYVNKFETEILVAEIFGDGEYSHPYIDFRPEDTIIDAGANIGVFSLFAYLACKRRCTIHAFEPVPIIYQTLTENIALHGAQDAITGHELGLTKPSMPERLDFTCYRNNYSTSSYRPQDKVIANHERIADPTKAMRVLRKIGHNAYWLARVFPFLRPAIARELRRHAEQNEVISCQTTTLSSMIESLGLTRIDLLKVDVEGAELDVLLGISDAYWPMIRQVVAEVHDIDGRKAKITGLLDHHGFEVVVTGNPTWGDIYDLHELVYARRREDLRPHRHGK